MSSKPVIVFAIFLGAAAAVLAQGAGQAPPPPPTETTAPAIAGVVAAGTRVQLIAQGLRGTEGPIAALDGTLLFTEQAASVITKVDANSPAAQKDVKPGDVIVEVTQEKVKQPRDVLARLDAVKKSGRRTVLLLLSDSKGGLRFVAVPTT